MAKATTNADLGSRLDKLERGHGEICQRLEQVEHTQRETTKQIDRNDKHLNEQLSAISEKLEEICMFKARSEEREQQICEQVESLNTLLRGDGDSDDKPGLKRRIEGCERELDERRGNLKLLWTAVVAIGAAVVGSIVTFGLKLFSALGGTPLIKGILVAALVGSLASVCQASVVRRGGKISPPPQPQRSWAEKAAHSPRPIYARRLVNRVIVVVVPGVHVQVGPKSGCNCQAVCRCQGGCKCETKK